MDSRLYENPSAGKFNPPPAPVDPMATRPTTARWWFKILLALLALYPVLLGLIRSDYPGSRFRAFLSFLVIPIVVLEIALKHWHSQEQGDDSPYSPPNRVTAP